MRRGGDGEEFLTISPPPEFQDPVTLPPPPIFRDGVQLNSNSSGVSSEGGVDNLASGDNLGTYHMLNLKYFLMKS